MFDIGFGELVLIFVVALLVFGPNKIPTLVRDVGYWVGRFRGFVSGVRGEVENELRKHEHWQRLVEEQAEIVKRNVADAVKPNVPIEQNTPPVGDAKPAAELGPENPRHVPLEPPKPHDPK